MGLRIPDDVAIVGFDDAPWSKLVDPPLTVVAQPTYEMGRTAAEYLLRRVGGFDGAPTQIRLGTQLLERASSGSHLIKEA